MTSIISGVQTSFWRQLPLHFVGLSPMDGVTDVPFRTITKKYGKPDLMFTEFSSVEGLCRGAVELMREFRYTEAQRPLVAQIYGTTPEFFRQMTVALCQLGFDGIDINMGCPAKNVAHAGAGAALIKTPDLALEIIKAAHQGVSDWQNGMNAADCANLTADIVQIVKHQSEIMQIDQEIRHAVPISVKTRIGYDSNEVIDWVARLVTAEPTAITIHGRTLRQAYSGLADWEAIAQASLRIKQLRPETIVIGNGDVQDREMGQAYCRQYGLDGVLIGRACFGNPWVFGAAQSEVAIGVVALEHALLYEQTYSQDPKYSFLPMRKHLAWYIKGIPGAGEIRARLVRTNTSQEVQTVLTEYGLLPTTDK